MTKEWLLSSALLLAALILLRAILGRRMRPGLRCALWTLALLRLLLPVTLFHTNLSGTERFRQTVGPLVTAEESYETTQKPVYAGTMTDTPLSIEEAEERHGGEVYKIHGYPADGEKADLHTYFFRDSLQNLLARLLPKLWLAGVIVTAAAFLLENLRFALRLRKRRTRIEAEGPLPVYAAEGLDSGCLFGWTVYVSPDTAADPAQLRHVLAHERSHFRHGDSLRALFRTAALALHWFDPLVWWAAAFDRQDGELWADAAAVKRLGEGEREAYGKTLIALSAGKRRPQLLRAATTLSGSKKALRERVTMIARDRRAPRWLTALVLLLGTLAALCAFTGKRTEPEPLHSLTIAGSEGGSFPAGYAALISGEYAAGEEVLLTVRPDPGWCFDHWELSAGQVEDERSGDTTFTMPDSDAELKPVFAPDGRVTVTVSVTEGGSVKVIRRDEAGNESSYGVFSGMTLYFSAGETLTLIAEPNDGWTFIGWSAGVERTDVGVPRVTVTVPDHDETILAQFREAGGKAPVEEEDDDANPAVGTF